MTIDPKRYRRNRTPSSSAVQINLRFKRYGVKPTKDEVLGVLQRTIDNGVVPRGWEFAFIEWASPNKVRHHRASVRWVRGKLEDATESGLSSVISAVYEAPTRLGIVRDNGSIEPLDNVQSEYFATSGTPIGRGKAEHLQGLAFNRVVKWEQEILTVSRKLAGYKSHRHIVAAQKRLERAYRYYDRAVAESAFYDSQFVGEVREWVVEIGIDYGMD